MLRAMSLSRLRVFALIACLRLVGCSGASSDEPGEGGLCALTAEYRGRKYVSGGGLDVVPKYGRYLGEATVPGCDDEDGFRLDAYEIIGVPPNVGFASPSYPRSVFLVEGRTQLPAVLEPLRSPPTCAATDGRIRLDGPWLGIIGPGGETELDLVPPYVLEMQVDRATPSRYERSFLKLRIGPEMGRPLDREDVRASLWGGGTLSVVASCRGDRLVVVAVAASPPAA